MEKRLKTLSDLAEQARNQESWGRNRMPTFSRIRITLGYPADGWVQIGVFQAGYRGAVLRASDVYCPFLALHSWLRQLLRQQLPAMVSVDEEGQGKVLLATESPEGSEFMQLAVLVSEAREFGELAGSEEALVECTARRLEFVEAFAAEVERWLRQDLDPREYAGRRYQPHDTNEYRDLVRLDFGAIAQLARAEIGDDLRKRASMDL